MTIAVDFGRKATKTNKQKSADNGIQNRTYRMAVLIWIQILNHNFSHSAGVSERFFKKLILDKRGSDQTVPVCYSSFVTDSMHFNCT